MGCSTLQQSLIPSCCKCSNHTQFKIRDCVGFSCRNTHLPSLPSVCRHGMVRPKFPPGAELLARVCCCVTEAALRSSPPKRACDELVTVLHSALSGSYRTGTLHTSCKTNPVEFKTKGAHVEFDMKDSFDCSPHCWAENPMIKAEAPKSHYNCETHQLFIVFGEAVPVCPGGCWAFLWQKPLPGCPRRHWVLYFKPTKNRFNHLMRIKCARVQFKDFKRV